MPGPVSLVCSTDRGLHPRSDNNSDHCLQPWHQLDNRLYDCSLQAAATTLILPGTTADTHQPGLHSAVAAHSSRELHCTLVGVWPSDMHDNWRIEWVLLQWPLHDAHSDGARPDARCVHAVLL